MKRKIYALTTLLLVPSIFLGTQCHAWEETDFQRKSIIAYPFAPPGQTVIGAPRTYRIKKRDTLLDVARFFDLGYNEIEDANPGVDSWIPPPGDSVLIPTQWVLPCCNYQGIVLNIPEMRLYYFHSSSRSHLVTTYPVGLGREDWPTPRGQFRIRGKTVNPTWILPESIKIEHRREGRPAPDFIPGGHPDNPLGKYRLELTLPMYGIHGTNMPWGVGRQVSHGCIRLYPEDIEIFFPVIPVGTPGEFIYQPVKIGMLDGDIYAEVHRDIYQIVASYWREAQQLLRRFNWSDRVDPQLLAEALQKKSGLPVKISRRGQDLQKAQTETENGIAHQDNQEVSSD